MDTQSQTRPIPEDDDVKLAYLAKMIPDEPSVSTVKRWARLGVKSLSGKRVKLETVQLPGGKGSSMKRFKKFLEALQGVCEAGVEKEEPQPTQENFDATENKTTED